MGGPANDFNAMRRKLLTALAMLGLLIVTARVVERRTRPELVDEYGT